MDLSRRSAFGIGNSLVLKSSRRVGAALLGGMQEPERFKGAQPRRPLSCQARITLVLPRDPARFAITDSLMSTRWARRCNNFDTKRQ